MADKSAIEWTGATWNPTVGCSLVSPGCTNCYAMKVAHRLERMTIKNPKYAGTTREGGPGARPFVLGWGKEIVRQCRAAAVPVFVKQVGSHPTNREGERCPHIKDRKGGDIDEWPSDLRVREFPEVTCR